MKLAILFEGILSYVSYLRNDTVAASEKELSQVKRELLNLFAELENRVKTEDMMTNKLYREMELPLIFFVDYMIASSGLPIAQEWDKNRLARSKSIITGDKKFFDIFEDIYSKNDPIYDECLEIFYLFLILGFTGYYENNPDKIENIIYRITNRVPGIQLKQSKHIIHEKNYERTCETKKAIRELLPFKTIFWIILIFFLIGFVINLFLYYETSLPLLSEFKKIQDNALYQK